MPELTRRRSADHGNNCWHIYCGNVHVGTIAERTGNQEAAAVEFVFKYGVAPITMRLLDTATRTDDWKTDPDKIRDGISKSSEGIARVIVCLSLPSKLPKAA